MAELEPQSVPRIEDSRFLKGEGRFTADLQPDDCLHAVVVRSEHAHAVIRSIDAEAALAMDGVVAVYTAADLAEDGLGTLPSVAELSDGSPVIIPPRHALAVDRVRFVGDGVALVVARTHEMAVDAAEQVVVDCEPLPAVVDPVAALAPGAEPIWEQVPGNLAFHLHRGDAEATRTAFASAAHVVELDLVHNRVSALPLEPRAGIGEYDAATDRMTLTATAQSLHEIRSQAARSVFGVDRDRLHLMAPDVGGGFGLKNFLYPEWVLLMWAAKRHGQPVKWVAERVEELSAAAHGRDLRAQARLALDAQGNFLALEAYLVSNMGAYLSGGGPSVHTRALPTAMGGIYAIPNIYLETRGAITNTVTVDAYRGAGKPEANYIIERLIDAAARRCGFDAVELRTRNAFCSFPHQTALGMDIDGGRFTASLTRALELADRTGFESRRAQAAARGRLRGLGFGCFLETSRGAPTEGAELRFLDDSTVELRVGTESNGQGHETSFAQIASGLLGLPLESFRFVQADTDLTRMGHGHGGARSMHMGGGALAKAVAQCLDRARPVAARLLQAEPGDVAFAAGQFSVSDGRQVGLMEVAAAAADAGESLDTFAAVEDAPFTFPNGAHVAEVEIDPDTGAVTLERYLCVDDYGALVNPALAEGQVQGGIAQGIGQALVEHAVYDLESGQLLSGSLMDYALPAADLFPALEVHLEGEPTAANPLGVKGTGQAGAIAAPQAVMNAVVDALAPLGIEHVDMPATAERIWRAIRESRTAC